MKKAQSGASAGVLVLVIGIAIILYILFLPPEERADLLDENGDDDETGTVEDNREVVLDETPGLILKTKQTKFEHKIPSFNLFTRTEDTVLKKAESVYISSSKGEQQTKAVPLIIDERTTNVQLSLNVEDHKGRLIILLNGEEIFNGEVRSIFAPITLEGLQEENVIEFKVESVGWMFWTKNFYEISNIQITGTVESYSNRESRNTFLIGEGEKENIKEAYLLYFVDCKVSEVERLSIYINDRLISSKVPDCGSPVKTFIDPDDLMEGKNELRFFAEKGSYLLDQIFVKTELKEPIYPIYFFEVNETQYTLVKNRTLDAELTIKFVDDDERKAATLNINNLRTSLDTKEDEFNKSINTYIVEDSNFIRIEPETNLPISSLKIELK
ncbi:hypothetical protein JXB11_02035 [Candidatus Woesearchaeota archaeon]|nr:hypothetical protein [Candidatus Woesearchaeota archaeon]